MGGAYRPMDGELSWRALWPVVVLLLTSLAGLVYAGIVLSLLLA